MVRISRSLALGIAGSVMITGGAMAGDLPPLVVAATPASPPAAAAFDWAGPYVGAFGGVFNFDVLGAGINAGYNFVRGNVLFGGEVELVYLPAASLPIPDAAVRLGFVLDQNALVYAVAGIGWDFEDGGPLWTIGGGLAVALTHSFSFFAKAQVFGTFPVGPGGCCGYEVAVGMNFHPGN